MQPRARLALSVLLCAVSVSGAARAQRTRSANTQPPIEGVVDFVRARFEPTRGWFRLVADAQFVEDPRGGLTPVYATLTHPRVRRSDNAGYVVLPTFAEQFLGPMRVAIVDQPGVELRVTPIAARPSRARIDAGLVVYSEAWTDTDALFKSTPTHVDEYLLLRSSRAPTTWRYRLELGSRLARLRETPGAIEAIDADGAARLRANRPTAVDANGKRFTGEIHADGLSLALRIDLRDATFPVLVDPDWRPTADMAFGRFYNGAHVTPDGRVLVTGGCSASVCSGDLTIPACRTLVNSAEALDLDPRTWSRAGDDPVARFFHASVSLRDGSVLVAGGCTESTCENTTADAQQYDLATGQFRSVAPLAEARAGIAATLLADGRVLLAGGCSATGCTARSELYDPSTRTMTPVAAMTTARGRATVTTLADGRVLLVGGCTTITCASVLASAEVFDPRSERWATAAAMGHARAGHWAAALDDGRVIVGGGCSEQACSTILDDSEVFSPTTNSWVEGPRMGTRRLGAEAVRLPNGTVMVSQGCQSRTGCDLSNEVLDRSASRFDAIEGALTIRAFHRTIVHPPTQQVIALGGCQPRTCSWWNETYDISSIRPIEDAGADASSDGSLDASDAAALDADERDDGLDDSGVRADAAVQPEPAVQRPSCACRAPAAPTGRAEWAALFGALCLVRRRRRS